MRPSEQEASASRSTPSPAKIQGQDDEDGFGSPGSTDYALLDKVTAWLSGIDRSEKTMPTPSLGSKKRSYSQTSERSANQESVRPDVLVTPISKRQCLAVPVLSHTSDNQERGRARGTAQGHTYAGMQIAGQARVHMGNQIAEHITNNHVYQGFTTDVQIQIPDATHASEHEADVRLALTKLLVTIIQTKAMFLVLLQCAIHGATLLLPKQMNNLSINFEDAFGDRRAFDLGLIVDWEGFHFILTRAFRNRPGYHRVAKSGYRLHDRRRGNELINPQHPPPFSTVFQPGVILRMSVHFDWDEICYDKCPKCGLKQECLTNKETTCINPPCKFRYRGFVADRWVQEISEDADSNASIQANDGIVYPFPARTKPLALLDDVPSQFSSITISQEPDVHRYQQTCPHCKRAFMTQSGLRYVLYETMQSHILFSSKIVIVQILTIAQTSHRYS